jgi:hypothetical protein
MSAKKQLSAFYTAQGLTGKHRRKAMQYDLKQVKKLRNYCGDYQLVSLFDWHASPQGWLYWHVRQYP